MVVPACFFLTSEVPKQDLPQAVCSASAVSTLSKENPPLPFFHQRPVHGHLLPEDSTLRYDPIFRVISDWFHLLLRKWGMIAKAVFKPYIFSSKLSQAHFLLPYNFRFAQSRCSSSLTSPSCPSPAAAHDRLEERIYFLCCFPLISLTTKETTHIKAARGKS